MIYYVLCFSFMFLQVLARQAKKVTFLVWHSAKFERFLKKTEATFCYSNIEDFDKVVLATLQ